MGGAKKPQQRLNRPQGCGQCCHTPNPDHMVMNIIKLGTLYAHLRFRLTVFSEMGGARKPPRRLNRPQGCGQCCHTPNPDHRVMNIIKKKKKKKKKRGGVTTDIVRTSPVNDYQSWEELGNHNKDSIDHKGVVSAATPLIPTTWS